MEFNMIIRWNGRQYRVKVKRLNLNRTKEIFEVVGRNKSVVIESNRPILELKNLSSWNPTYKIVSGQFHTPGFERSLIAALEEGISNFKQTHSDNHDRK